MEDTFELLEEGVLVTTDAVLDGTEIGRTSYMVSYEDFYELLQKEDKEKSTGIGLKDIQRNWGGHYLGVPEGTLEILTVDGLDIEIKQLIGGNGVRNSEIKGKPFDTSRYLLDYELSYDKKEIETITVSEFYGLMWGYHKPEDIVFNAILTEKMSERVQGKKINKLGQIDMRLIMSSLLKDLTKESEDFKAECIRVGNEGGAIRWENYRS